MFLLNSSQMFLNHLKEILGLICYFKMEPDSSCVYTLSFVDNSGEEHFREFTDKFTESNQILLAIRYEGNVWTIDYDS